MKKLKNFFDICLSIAERKNKTKEVNSNGRRGEIKAMKKLN